MRPEYQHIVDALEELDTHHDLVGEARKLVNEPDKLSDNGDATEAALAERRREYARRRRTVSLVSAAEAAARVNAKHTIKQAFPELGELEED